MSTASVAKTHRCNNWHSYPSITPIK